MEEMEESRPGCPDREFGSGNIELRRYINAYSANARPIQWKYSDPSRRVRSNELTATGH
jgi:hypothetical protein